jgi:hypothetical protein
MIHIHIIKEKIIILVKRKTSIEHDLFDKDDKTIKRSQ